MSAQPDTQKKAGQSRRDFLRKVGVGSATAAGVSAGAVRLDHGPVQNSQAIPPVIAAGAAGAGVGWLLRETETFGSDSPPEGLTPDALQNEIYTRARERQSNNQSTFVDNLNFIESGATYTAYSEAKIRAFEELNEQKPQDEINNICIGVIEDHETTIQKNLQRSWNESVDQFESFVQSVRAHEDLTEDDIGYSGRIYEYDVGSGFVAADLVAYEPETEQIELPDGSTMDNRRMVIETDDDDLDRIEWGPYSASVSYHTGGGGLIHGYEVHASTDGNTVEYLKYGDWSDLFSTLEEEFSSVKDEFTVWLDGVYDQVQSGEIETSDLLTPREQAELTADDEEFPQAIADLQALNIGTDLEREAEIYLPDISATLYGQLAYSGDEKLSVGPVDPDGTDDEGDPLYTGEIYFSYDVSQGEGQWEAHDDGIDGGLITFTSEPFEATTYVVTTTSDETAQFHASDLSKDDDGETWVVDVSDQLDDNVTNVESIEYSADTDQTEFEVVQLTDPFEIKAFTDSDGNEYEETNFERNEPHTDENYITQEEWDEQQERHEELIEKYEDAQGGGGITIGGASIPNELIGLVLAVAAAIGLLR